MWPRKHAALCLHTCPRSQPRGARLAAATPWRLPPGLCVPQPGRLGLSPGVQQSRCLPCHEPSLTRPLPSFLTEAAPLCPTDEPPGRAPAARPPPANARSCRPGTRVPRGWTSALRREGPRAVAVTLWAEAHAASPSPWTAGSEHRRKAQRSRDDRAPRPWDVAVGASAATPPPGLRARGHSNTDPIISRHRRSASTAEHCSPRRERPRQEPARHRSCRWAAPGTKQPSWESCGPRARGSGADARPSLCTASPLSAPPRRPPAGESAGHRGMWLDQRPQEERRLYPQRKGRPTRRAEPSAHSKGPSPWARGSQLQGGRTGPSG